MLFVNLLPPEQRERENPLPSQIDQHPFFGSLLAISGSGGNPILGTIAESGIAGQAAFLTSVAHAYGAFSMAAPLAFRRVAELTESPEAGEIARRLFDTEMGRSPLAGASGISHLELFLRLVESLLPGLEVGRPQAEEFAVHRDLKINQVSLIEALALCEEIETSGRGVILAWQDLVAQWQVFLGIRTEKIDRAFLDEHSLVGEGIGRMLAPYAELRASEPYSFARERARRAFVQHFDEATREILSRLE